MGHIEDAPVYAMWPDELDVRYLDGRNWRLLSDFRFVNPSPRFPSICIPAGTETDFASIPQVLWNLISPTDHRIGRIAVVHDRFYRCPDLDISRKQADGALEEGMKVLGADWLLRHLVYAGVRVGGGHAYQKRTVHE